jgi:hypothetical protein
VRAQRLRVADDRVGAEVGQVIRLLLRRQARKRPDRRRAPRAALVEQDQPVVLEGALLPAGQAWRGRPRRLRSRPALEEDEIRTLAIVVGGELAREEGDRRSPLARVVEWHLQLVLGRRDACQAVGRGHVG